jgi:hypothetical protein
MNLGISGRRALVCGGSSEFGDLVAFLCSAQSGIRAGQNIVSDGGVYQGLF